MSHMDLMGDSNFLFPQERFEVSESHQPSPPRLDMDVDHSISTHYVGIRGMSDTKFLVIN